MSELKQTDLSKRLRHFAQQQPTVIISADFAIQCAEEIERYFNGMRNWKASAEAMHRTQPEATKPAQDLGAAILEQAAQACDQQADGTNGAYRTACLQCANAVRELRDAAIQAQKDGHG